MKFLLSMTVAAAAVMCLAPASAQDTRGGPWPKREPFKPDPTKIIVPPDYKVGVFAAGLDTPSSATVDKDGNLWVAISGVLLGSPEADKIDPPHVKIFDKQGKLLREVGKGTFKTVMNEIGYCAENGKTYIPEYGEKIWEMDGVNGELKLIIKDLPIGDHRNGGITCKDGYIYFAMGFPRAASQIPIITAGRISRMIRSGSSTRTAMAPRRMIRYAATSCIRASPSNPRTVA